MFLTLESMAKHFTDFNKLYCTLDSIYLGIKNHSYIYEKVKSIQAFTYLHPCLHRCNNGKPTIYH